jgi:hypothetical protein
VEHSRSQYGIGACGDRRREVGNLTRAAGCDKRHIDLAAYRADHLQVEAIGSAIGVHGIQQNLADAMLNSTAGPLDRIETRGCSPSMSGYFKTRRCPACPAGIHRKHQHLIAEPPSDFGDHVRPMNGASVDRHFVGAGA